MVSSSAIKKVSIVIATLLVIVLLLCSASFAWGRGLLLLGFGPKPLYEVYPTTVWASSDPQINMTVSDNPYDRFGSYLVVNGEKIQVVIYISQREDVADISVLSSDGKGRRTVLLGEHVRVSDSTISFSVTEDKLYGGKYSIIILERQR